MTDNVNTGQDAEKEFEQKLTLKYGKKVFIERLPDTKSIKGSIKNGFIQGRPSDYILTIDGEMCYAEVKSCGDKTSFPFSNIRKDQWKAAIQQVAAGGVYLFFIKNTNTNQWFVVEARTILEKKKERNSIKWTELQTWVL